MVHRIRFDFPFVLMCESPNPPRPSRRGSRRPSRRRRERGRSGPVPASVERGGRRSPRSLETGLPVIEPRNPLRDSPTRMGHPSVSNRSKVPQYLEVVLRGSCQSRFRGRWRFARGGCRGLRPIRYGERGSHTPRSRHPVGGVSLHGGGGALHVHEDDAGAGFGGDAGHFGIGSQRADIVDDRGPAAEACRAISALVVSIEIGDLELPAIASTTGMTRVLFQEGTGSAPGRVDSPPTSRMSAPARPGLGESDRFGDLRISPPSEKLSGVRFKMPITLGTGSDRYRPCGRGLPSVWWTGGSILRSIGKSGNERAPAESARRNGSIRNARVIHSRSWGRYQRLPSYRRSAWRCSG